MPILFSVFTDDLLRKMEKDVLGLQLGGGKKVEGCSLLMIKRSFTWYCN